MPDQPTNPKRRKLIWGGLLGGAVLAAPWLRPGDRGGAHNAYFLRLQTALQEAGLYRPTLVLDSQRLQDNSQRLMNHLAGQFHYRIVAKSLPSLDLLGTVRRHTGSDRVMVFHQPFLNLIAGQMPDTHLLLGKPMPAIAAKRFYSFHNNRQFDPSRRLQWLVDSPARLAQYRELAASLQQPLKINLELDVGLHRGGFQKAQAVAEAIRDIEQDPYLQFSGFMGYEAHASKMPALIGGPQEALAKAMRFYQQCVDAAQAVLGTDYQPERLTLNAGGSSTYQLYEAGAPCNELAIGSGLVKPSDFDVPTLSDHIPAAFIATPVIKALDHTRIPGLESLTGLFPLLDPNKQRSFFSYGGYWKAAPVSPPGLATNSLYGRSSNQEMLNGSRRVTLNADDFVFLWPSQSEAVFLQFGDIAVFDGHHISALWPIFQQGA